VQCAHGLADEAVRSLHMQNIRDFYGYVELIQPSAVGRTCSSVHTSSHRNLQLNEVGRGLFLERRCRHGETFVRIFSQAIQNYNK
jgi:hypothetical protein